MSKLLARSHKYIIILDLNDPTKGPSIIILLDIFNPY
jgi:hypothetical protein